MKLKGEWMKLAECQYCESRDAITEERSMALNPGTTIYWVRCQDCNARGSEAANEIGAILAWNKFYGSPEHMDQIKSNEVSND